MKINPIRPLLIAGFLALTAGALLGGCGKSDIEAYSSKDKLWFTQKDEDGVVISKQETSFALFPGSETIEVEFELRLIGSIANHEREYKLVVVDTLTTALPSEYELLPTIFPANAERDKVRVKLIKSERMTTESVTLGLCIVENENFTTGYTGRLMVNIVYNNISLRPKWWTAAIADSYFGPWTKEKYDAFYNFSGRTHIEGLEPSDLRALLLEFRVYIAENNLTEKDGSPITLPIH